MHALPWPEGGLNLTVCNEAKCVIEEERVRVCRHSNALETALRGDRGSIPNEVAANAVPHQVRINEQVLEIEDAVNKDSGGETTMSSALVATLVSPSAMPRPSSTSACGWARRASRSPSLDSDALANTSVNVARSAGVLQRIRNNVTAPLLPAQLTHPCRTSKGTGEERAPTQGEALLGQAKAIRATGGRVGVGDPPVGSIVMPAPAAVAASPWSRTVFGEPLGRNPALTIVVPCWSQSS